MVYLAVVKIDIIYHENCLFKYDHKEISYLYLACMVTFHLKRKSLLV